LLYVGGFLQISNNEQLQNLSGLRNINSISGHINFSGNDLIENFEGLDML